ncbi:hypothetical protein BOO93_15775 [Vibrio navarrensis]|nr:hypothetical protein [Vibrio navarrensis]
MVLGKEKAEERVLGSGPLVLGRARAEKEGTRLIGTRLLGRARAEEKERFPLLFPALPCSSLLFPALQDHRAIGPLLTALPSP